MLLQFLSAMLRKGDEKLKYQLYLVIKELEGDQKPSRSELAGALANMYADLARKISQHFPEVRIVEREIMNLVIAIPVLRGEHIADRISKSLGCIVALSDEQYNPNRPVGF